MGLFVTPELFPIDIKYIDVPLAGGGSAVYIIKTEEDEVKYAGQVKELQTQWIRLNFKEQISLLQEATLFDPVKGEKDVDQFLLRALIMEKCMKHWDAVDDKGDKVPCTSENIATLDPAVAYALIEKYNAHNLPTEEYLKN
jgi:hypothetical protein